MSALRRNRNESGRRTSCRCPLLRRLQPFTSDAEETFERETGRRTVDAPLLTVNPRPLLEQQLKPGLSRRLEVICAPQDELRRQLLAAQGLAEEPEYARVVERRFVDELVDDLLILRRKIDELIEDVK